MDLNELFRKVDSMEPVEDYIKTKQLFRHVDKLEHTKHMDEPKKFTNRKLFYDIPQPIPLNELPVLEHHNTYSNYKYQNLNVEDIFNESKSLQLLDIIQHKLINYVEDNYNLEGRFRLVICNFIYTINEIKCMCKNPNDITIAIRAIGGMRISIEQSYKYCKNLRMGKNLNSELMGKKNTLKTKNDLWGDRYARYHVAPHGDLDGLKYSVRIMLDDVNFCLKKLCKRNTNLELALNI